MTIESNLGLHRPNQVSKVTVAYRKYFPNVNHFVLWFLYKDYKNIHENTKRIHNQKLLVKNKKSFFSLLYLSILKLSTLDSRRWTNICEYLLIFVNVLLGAFRIISNTIYIGLAKKRHSVRFCWMCVKYYNCLYDAFSLWKRRLILPRQECRAPSWPYLLLETYTVRLINGLWQKQR